MKKIVFAFAILAVVCGCRSTITVNGVRCATLHDSEIEELVTVARYTLRKNLDNPKVVTPSQYSIAKTTAPEIKIEYFGNITGTARVTWDFPECKTTVMIRGELTNPQNRYIAVSIVEKLPDIIDTTNSIPKDAPVWKMK